MDNADILERQTLGALLKMIREITEKEEETHEHNHTDDRSNPGQPEAAR